MNAQTPIDFVDTNMTSKGQVLIPKALRQQAGLVPTEAVQVGLNEAGEIVVRPKQGGETADARVVRVREALNGLRGSVDTGFASTDEYMDSTRPWRREP